MYREIPVQWEGVTENFYAGFWTRLGALIVDGLFILPVSLLIVYLNSYGLSAYLLVFIPAQLFWFWYMVYLVKEHGGTPGKLIMDIKIIKINGEDIGWKEAILRASVELGLALYMAILTGISMMLADAAQYETLSWFEKQVYLSTMLPAFFSLHSYLNGTWVWGEMIVLLTNKRKRAPHDYLAGTVIVKTKYLDQIREVMNVKPTVEYGSVEREAVASA